MSDVRYGRCPRCARPVQSDQGSCPGCAADLARASMVPDPHLGQAPAPTGLWAWWQALWPPLLRGATYGVVLALVAGLAATALWSWRGGVWGGWVGRVETLAVLPCWLLAGGAAMGERIGRPSPATGGAGAVGWRLLPPRRKRPGAPRPTLTLVTAGLPAFAAALLLGSG